MIPLDDIELKNGATEFIVDSNKNNLKLSSLEIENSEKFQLILKRGSLASWTGKLWHRSTTNSTAKPRVVLLIMFVASYIREAGAEENYYRGIQSLTKLSNQELFKQLIGYEQGKKKGMII